MNPELFDAVEIHRCVACMDAGMYPYVEPIDEGEELPGEAEGAPFWSVYLHHDSDRCEGTGMECVADCATQEQTQLVADGLRQWIRSTA
jgi:hypothetical protein